MVERGGAERGGCREEGVERGGCREGRGKIGHLSLLSPPGSR